MLHQESKLLGERFGAKPSEPASHQRPQAPARARLPRTSGKIANFTATRSIVAHSPETELSSLKNAPFAKRFYVTVSWLLTRSSFLHPVTWVENGHLAERVIRRVTAEFHDRVDVQPYFWEYEPMDSTRDYQENIPLTSDFDLVICILWKRLGSPLSVKHERPDGGRWRSGTEFELVTAVESKKVRGTPDIFIFKNDTKPTFEADEAGEGAKTELDLAQWKALIAFIKECCEGV
jgi:hypothetical protein